MIDKKDILEKIEKGYHSFTCFIIELLFFSLVIVLLIPLLAQTLIDAFDPNSVTVNDVILFITAVLIIVYAYETQKMKEEIKKQNEIQEKPVLNLYLRKSEVGPNKQYALRLRNVGNGPAYNISFSDINASNYIYYPYFNDPNPILEKDGDEKTIELWVKTPDGGIEDFEGIAGFQFFLSRLFPKNVSKEKQEYLKRTAAIFLINYQGVNNKRYYSIFRLYSKIWPGLDVYDLVVEFVASGEGGFDMKRARTICSKGKTMKRFKKNSE
jgi:hypothetical protein